MGVNIELKKYPYEKLKEELLQNEKINDPEMLEKILLTFGEKIADTYILLNNELYEDGNCYYKVLGFIDKYFKLEYPEESYRVFSKLKEECISYVTYEEAQEKLEISFSEKY